LYYELQLKRKEREKGCEIKKRIDEILLKDSSSQVRTSISKFFISSSHTIFDRIIAMLANTIHWPPDIMTVTSLSNLTPVFQFQTLILHLIDNVFHKNKLLSLPAKY